MNKAVRLKNMFTAIHPQPPGLWPHHRVLAVSVDMSSSTKTDSFFEIFILGKNRITDNEWKFRKKIDLILCNTLPHSCCDTCSDLLLNDTVSKYLRSVNFSVTVSGSFLLYSTKKWNCNRLFGQSVSRLTTPEEIPTLVPAAAHWRGDAVGLGWDFTSLHHAWDAGAVSNPALTSTGHVPQLQKLY